MCPWTIWSGGPMRGNGAEGRSDLRKYFFDGENIYGKLPRTTFISVLYTTILDVSRGGERMALRNNRLKELRKGKRLYQTDLAEMLGIQPRQYQRYEYGEQSPSIESWIALADFYNVSLDYLVGRSDVRERR